MRMRAKDSGVWGRRSEAGFGEGSSDVVEWSNGYVGSRSVSYNETWAAAMIPQPIKEDAT